MCGSGAFTYWFACTDSAHYIPEKSMITFHLKARLVYSLGALLCLLASSSFASEDNVDFDSSADFNKFHTFQLIPNPDGTLAKQDPIMDQRIQGMIAQEFVKQGLTQVTENPDLQVTYDSSTQDHYVLNTMGPGMGIGFGVGWRRWGPVGGVGMGMATTTTTEFTDGTLVIDAWTLNPKTMVWRGVAEASVVSDPQRTTENIQRSLNSLFEKWDQIKKKQYGD